MLSVLSPTCAQGGDVAKQLLNPFATLARVPVELAYDRRIGPANDGKAYSLAVTPLIPFDLDADWTLVSRTNVTVIAQTDVIPGAGRQTGLGDTLQSFHFSPRKETEGGTYWGAGAIFLLPTATNEMLGSKTFGAGPTGGVFRDVGPWTAGIVGYHVWSVAGRASISATSLQPSLSYTTPDNWSYTLQTEAIYDWKGREWSVPLEGSVAKLVRIGGEQVNLEAGAHYWTTGPDSGPKGWGWSFAITWLIPK